MIRYETAKLLSVDSNSIPSRQVTRFQKGECSQSDIYIASIS